MTRLRNVAIIVNCHNHHGDLYRMMILMALLSCSHVYDGTVHRARFWIFGWVSVIGITFRHRRWPQSRKSQ
jgi:hypothetical protein